MMPVLRLEVWESKVNCDSDEEAVYHDYNLEPSQCVLNWYGTFLYVDGSKWLQALLNIKPPPSHRTGIMKSEMLPWKVW